MAIPACPPPTPSEGSSSSEALFAFCQLLEGDLDLQSRVKAAETPKQIIDIAGSIGHHISFVELRVWSRELAADYFPWATMGHEWRRNFFKRKG